MFHETEQLGCHESRSSGLGSLGASPKKGGGKGKTGKSKTGATQSGPLRAPQSSSFLPYNISEQLAYGVIGAAEKQSANEHFTSLPAGSRVQMWISLTNVHAGYSLVNLTAAAFIIGSRYLTTRGLENSLKTWLSKDFTDVAVSVSKGLGAATINVTTRYDFADTDHARQRLLIVMQGNGLDPIEHKYQVLQLAHGKRQPPLRNTRNPDVSPTSDAAGNFLQNLAAGTGIGTGVLVLGAVGILILILKK